MSRGLSSEKNEDQDSGNEKHSIHLNIDGNCFFLITIPGTFGHYKFACVLAVLRDIRVLYVGCLATIKADESTFSCLFY